MSCLIITTTTYIFVIMLYLYSLVPESLFFIQMSQALTSVFIGTMGQVNRFIRMDVRQVME